MPLPKVHTCLHACIGARHVERIQPGDPRGTLDNKTLIIEAGGGETLTGAESSDGFGPSLVPKFDTGPAVDGSYKPPPGHQSLG